MNETDKPASPVASARKDAAQLLNLDTETMERWLVWGEQVEEASDGICGLTGEAFWRAYAKNALKQWQWWRERCQTLTEDSRGRIELEVAERQARGLIRHFAEHGIYSPIKRDTDPISQLAIELDRSFPIPASPDNVSEQGNTELPS